MVSIQQAKEFLKLAPKFNAANLKDNQTDRQNLIRAAVEVDQKRTLRHPIMIKAKKAYNGICPCCNMTVKQLTAAHIGKRRSDIIRDIVDTYPDATLTEILKYLNEENKKVDLVIVCAKCNNLIEKATC
jgi:hypothetical protein